MSGYNGRRGPNVSQYIANLNAVSPPQDPLGEPRNVEDEFSLFTNADFFDGFEAGAGSVDLSAPALDFNLDVGDLQTSQASLSNPRSSEPKMDFNLSGDFPQFAGFDFTNPIVDPSIQSLPSQPGSFPVAPAYTSPVSATVSPIAQGFEHSVGKKRKLDTADSNSQQAIDEAARVAAEEDKRRRNTAASARFRIKKKQREQALEAKAKDMENKVTKLEARVQQLETENAWLRGLITDGSGGKTSSSDIRAMLNKHEESNSERSTGGRTDGVGTKREASKA